MLCQLVCVDRRYQRMNCFNIRELQGNLKRKFFSDLVNSNDHREVLSNSMIGLRFKSDNSLNLNQDILSFYTFGTNNVQKSRTNFFTNLYTNELNNTLSQFNNYTVSFFIEKKLSNMLNSLVFGVQELFIIVPMIIVNVKFLILFNIKNVFFSIQYFNSNCFNYDLYTNYYLNYFNSSNYIYNKAFISFTSDNSSNPSLDILYSGVENNNYQRSNRFYNSFVSYDYKCGNYIGI
jgi:hypothetical protein